MILKICSVVSYWFKCLILGGMLHALSLLFCWVFLKISAAV